MKKYIILTIIALTTILIISFVFNNCKIISAGHIGIVCNLYVPDNEGNWVSCVTGLVWRNPFNQEVYEYPTYVQTIDYPAFEVYAKDGFKFTVDPTVSLKIIDGKAVPIFIKYRKDIHDIIAGPLFNDVRETYRIQLSRFTTDEIISVRDSVETVIKGQLAIVLEKEGFQLEQLTSGLTYSERHCKCCHSPSFLLDMESAGCR